MTNENEEMNETDRDWKKEIDDVVKAWWDEEIHKNPQQRAQIQRCADLHTVVFTPAFQKLRIACLIAGIRPHEEYLALVAGVVGRLREDSTTHPAEEMATGKRPLLHPLRFDRLVKGRERQETYREMISVLPLLDHTANVGKLAHDLYWWGEGLDSKTRKKWYTVYYEKVHLPDELLKKKGV